MATPQISKKFTFNPTPATLRINVEKHIESLIEHGFDAGKILDIYIESQKLNRGIKNLTNPMRYLASYLDEAKGNSDVRFRELERIYNNVVRDWSKIKPANFMQQYLTYINQGVNDTGIDNGFIREHFLDFSMKEEKLLIINPHPVVMEECLKSDKDISFAFTNDRYYQVYLTSDAAKKLEKLHNLPPERYHRVLSFCNDSTQDEIADLLDILSPALDEQTKTNIYIVMPTKYVEKRYSQPVLWDYLIQHFTIFKICLIDQKAVNTNPKKRCLMILQNTHSSNDTILIQKSKLINANTFATLEFRRIPFESFANRDRTLSEMYNTDYIDYSDPNRRNKPIEYKFTREISIWTSCSCDKDGKYRPFYSVYNYPTTDQMRKNTLLRGTAIKTRIPGKRYSSKEEALASAEHLLYNDPALAKMVRAAVIEQYKDQPISVKTLLFLHWDALSTMKGFDTAFCRSEFFLPNSAEKPICALLAGVATEETIKNVVGDYASESGCSKTKSDALWKQLQMIFDCAVIDGKYARNPVRNLLYSKNEANKNKTRMRSSLVSRSFSKEVEQKLIALLLSDKENSVLAQMLLIKYFTRLPYSILCALTWGDFIYNPNLDLGQLSITKKFLFQSQTATPIPEEQRRFVPLVSIAADILKQRIANGECKSHKQPLFSFPETRNKPVTVRQLQSYFNGIFQKLNLPEFNILIFDEHKSPESNDINDYGGDILLTNFEHHGYYDALMEPEELDFLAGRKPRTTEAQYYCDYNNVFLQLIMCVKLERWVATLLPAYPNMGMHYTKLDSGESLKITPKITNRLSELYLELDLEGTIEDEEILLSLAAKYGGASTIEFLEEEI